MNGSKRTKTVEVREDGRLIALFSSEAKADTFRKELKAEGRSAIKYIRYDGGAKPASAKKKATKSRSTRPTRLLDADGRLDPWMIEGMDDLRDYAVYESPGLKDALYDPEVWAWICDYTHYVEWKERGNRMSLPEYAEDGYLADLVRDLTRKADPRYTYYLEDDDDPNGREARLLRDARASSAGTAWSPMKDNLCKLYGE